MKRLNLLTTLAVALGIGFASCSEDNLPIGPDVDTVVESDLKITRAALETNDPWIALGFKKTGNTWSALGNYNKKDNKDTARYKITFDEDVLKYRFIAATPQQASIITLKENDSTTFAVNLAHSSDVAISYKDVKFSRPADKTQIIDSTIALPNMRHQAALLGFNISMQDKRNSSGEQMNPFYGWYIKIDTFQLHNVLKEGVVRFIKDGENKGNQADKVEETSGKFIVTSQCAFTNKQSSTTQYVQVAMVPYKYSETHSVTADLIMHLINPADPTDTQRVSYTVGLFSLDDANEQTALNIFSGRAYSYNLKIAASQPQLFLYVSDWDGDEQTSNTTVGGGNSSEGTNDDGTPKTPDNVSDWIIDWESTWGNGGNNNDYNSLGD